MSESPACLNAKASLNEIIALKKSFGQAYDAAVATNQPNHLHRARELKGLLEQKIEQLEKKMWMHETESALQLQAQYESQITLLKQVDILKQAPQSPSAHSDFEPTFYVEAIDKTPCPLPSLEAIRSHMFEKRAFLRVKMEQGFTKLLLVPFGAPLGAMTNALCEYLLAQKTKSDGVFKFDEVDTFELSLSNFHHTDDQTGKIVYEPVEFGANHQGKTKKALLDEQRETAEWDRGWRIILVQARTSEKGIASIPDESIKIKRGKEHKRMDIVSGKLLPEYLEKCHIPEEANDSPYRGERGATLEDWIITCMTHLEETGEYLDDISNYSSDAGLFGSYRPEDDRMPVVCTDSERGRITIVDIKASEIAQAEAHSIGTRNIVRI